MLLNPQLTWQDERTISVPKQTCMSFCLCTSTAYDETRQRPISPQPHFKQTSNLAYRDLSLSLWEPGSAQMRGCPTDSEYRLTGWDAKLAAIAEAPFSPGNPLPQPCAARRLRETAASRMLKIRSERSIYTVFSCNQANESRKMAARKELQIMSDHHHLGGPSNNIRASQAHRPENPANIHGSQAESQHAECNEMRFIMKCKHVIACS